MKFQLGLFETALRRRRGGAARLPDAGRSARWRARSPQQSIVLLKNDGDLLPLDRDVERLAVIGPSADDVRLLQGDYSYPAHLEIIYQSAHRAAAATTSRRAPTSVAFRPGPTSCRW